MTVIPTLETARLRLRPYRLEDFDDYVAMWADPAVVRFIGGVPFTREASWGRFIRQIGMWHAMGFGFFALEHRETGAYAGEAGFHEARRAITPSLEGTMECGWGLTSAMHGQGLAEEAMRAALGWAAENGKGERLTCIVDEDNAASLRVAGKLGFREFARSAYNGTPIVLLERPRRA
ncbi:MAG: GNAT family N-acetyltransferase [Devosia nanyangense]|uniref:GNAT family N-acetyltransferase n=1 Tax=Devosia nanyangense TaxID=1228055 RepID=A0A933L5Q9_9HYPH|nr:GNAT family N-acetyltransferase [Devosia nanyangense]